MIIYATVMWLDSGTSLRTNFTVAVVHNLTLKHKRGDYKSKNLFFLTFLTLVSKSVSNLEILLLRLKMNFMIVDALMNQ